MRDIRKDLEERLASIAEERVALQTKIEQLMQAESGVKMLLRQEEQRFAISSPPLFPMEKDSSNESGGFRQFVLDQLQQKNRPLDKEELKEFALHTLDFGHKAPGRVLHFALVGLQTSGLINRLKDGRWELNKHQEAAAN